MMQDDNESDLKAIISSSQQQVRRFQQLLSEERSLSVTSTMAGLRCFFSSSCVVLCVNFMAAKNPDILQWKCCCCCLQNLCKLCLWYCGATSNYSRINSHASKEWMVTLVSHTQCLVTTCDLRKTVHHVYDQHINRPVFICREFCHRLSLYRNIVFSDVVFRDNCYHGFPFKISYCKIAVSSLAVVLRCAVNTV